MPIIMNKHFEVLLTNKTNSPITVPLIKKPGLDCEVLKNYRPVSTCLFHQKLLKKLFLFVYYNISLIIT